ncbi:MAG: phosphatase PAP2 family protein [Chloroflexi bacterium]|nr:MAG: phosphatase PAP2 family protein [Chloroflexota bacterium]TMD82382.1 MAG: phosphatase PAP2 family protein [Chloroflexota bacterium]
MRDAVAGDTPGRPRHRVLPLVPALRRPRWPALSRRLMITAGAFLAAFALMTALVMVGAFDAANLGLTRYLQGRGSAGQDIGLGLFSYLGSIEVTVVIAVMLGFALFRGLRLLAVLPAVLVLIASGLEILLKNIVPSLEPGTAFQRFPHGLPSLSHDVGAYSFPSGHVLRATIVYGLVLYLAERWELFGRDSSRLSPVLVLVVFFVGFGVVYLGWHWLSDALGGLLLGLTLLFGLIAYLERKRTVNPGHQTD